MENIAKEGGLATDGLEVDPVSGNDIPPGSNAVDVRDDIDARLSEGEYVVPADVVKFFGVSYFEKLRKKAKEGLQEMEDDGRLGGEPVLSEEVVEEPQENKAPTLEEDIKMLEGYNEGGLAKGNSYNAIVNRVSQAAAASPAVSNILKAKGISLTKDDKGTLPKVKGYAPGGVITSPGGPQGSFTPKKVVTGGPQGSYNPLTTVASKSFSTAGSNLFPTANSIDFTKKPDGTDTDPYDPATYLSSFNPFDYYLGFSSMEGNQLDLTPTKFGLQDKDIDKKEVETPDYSQMGPEDREAAEHASRPGAWMDSLEMDDPNKVVEQIEIELGLREDESISKLTGIQKTIADRMQEIENNLTGKNNKTAKGILGALTGGVKGIVGLGLTSLIGHISDTAKMSKAVALSDFYEAIGLTELSDELEAAAIAFGVKNNVKLDKNFFRQDIKMFNQVVQNYNTLTDEQKKALDDIAKKGIKSTKGKTDKKGTKDTTPTKNAPKTSTRPTSRPSRLQGPAGYVGYQAGQVDPGLAAAIGITPSSSTSSKSASDAGYGTDPKGEFGDTPTAPSGTAPSGSASSSPPDGISVDSDPSGTPDGTPNAGFGSADWGGGDAATGALNKGGFIKPRNKAKAKSYKKGLGLR
jgi:hypothetical protein